MLLRSFMLCDKAMLSAAAMIGRGHPDDAGPITRRAIEIATTTAAILHKPANLQAWKASEERGARWEARARGETPKTLRVHISWPDHPLIEELRHQVGVLSDVSAHFTPEYELGQGWHHEFVEGEKVKVSLAQHSRDERELRKALIDLVAIHDKILRLFDWCLEGAFSANERWRHLRTSLVDAAGRASEEYLAEEN